jgi:hypothetical protein
LWEELSSDVKFNGYLFPREVDVLGRRELKVNREQLVHKLSI